MEFRQITLPLLAGAVVGLAVRAALPNISLTSGLQPPPAKAAAQPPAAAAVPEAPRKPHAPPKPDELREIEIKELGNFEYDPVKGGLPEDVKALTGLKIRVRGYMMPLADSERITQFVLVPSLLACCYGQPPQVQHVLECETVKGMSVPYYPDEVNVVGKLTVEEKKEEGFVISIFSLKVTSVQPAPVGPVPSSSAPQAATPAPAAAPAR